MDFGNSSNRKKHQEKCKKRDPVKVTSSTNAGDYGGADNQASLQGTQHEEMLYSAASSPLPSRPARSDFSAIPLHKHAAFDAEGPSSTMAPSSNHHSVVKERPQDNTHNHRGAVPMATTVPNDGDLFFAPERPGVWLRTIGTMTE